eukprot:scaffold74499_cov19-Tisochrysis_lutea.AAC.1
MGSSKRSSLVPFFYAKGHWKGGVGVGGSEKSNPEFKRAFQEEISHPPVTILSVIAWRLDDVGVQGADGGGALGSTEGKEGGSSHEEDEEMVENGARWGSCRAACNMNANAGQESAYGKCMGTLLHPQVKKLLVRCIGASACREPAGKSARNISNKDGEAKEADKEEEEEEEEDEENEDGSQIGNHAEPQALHQAGQQSSSKGSKGKAALKGAAQASKDSDEEEDFFSVKRRNVFDEPDGEAQVQAAAAAAMGTGTAKKKKMKIKVRKEGDVEERGGEDGGPGAQREKTLEFRYV